jgi:hypothetical protein
MEASQSACGKPRELEKAERADPVSEPVTDCAGLKDSTKQEGSGCEHRPAECPFYFLQRVLWVFELMVRIDDAHTRILSVAKST